MNSVVSDLAHQSPLLTKVMICHLLVTTADQTIRTTEQRDNQQRNEFKRELQARKKKRYFRWRQWDASRLRLRYLATDSGLKVLDILMRLSGYTNGELSSSSDILVRLAGYINGESITSFKTRKKILRLWYHVRKNMNCIFFECNYKVWTPIYIRPIR